ncbi:MAG: TIR domain-containing protein [Planctomycetes bacterium]|nr:TIR domain-containing protein [Planctomycetota bacterium]
MKRKPSIGGKDLYSRVKAVKALLHGELLSAVSAKTGFDTQSLREWRKQFELGGKAQLAGVTISELTENVPLHFVSYSRKDRTIALPIFDELRACGVRIWVDERAISGGDMWRTKIDKAIRVADTFILMLSPNAVDSDEVMRELKLAVDLGKDLLPVKIRPVKISPVLGTLIGNIQILSLTSNRRERTEMILEALGETDAPSAPPYQQMVFRQNVNRIVETTHFLQNCSWAAGNLILSASNDSDDNSYVQFAASSGTDDPIFSEAVGDRNRAKEHKLSNDQKATLRRLGWRNPSSTSAGNYWRKFPAKSDTDRRAMAKILMRTLIEVYGHLPGEEVFHELQQNR